MTEPTRLTNLEVEENVLIDGYISASVSAGAPVVTGVTVNAGAMVIGVLALQKADNYSLAAAEKSKVFIGCEMTAGSKVLTLGLTAGQMVIVKNVGATNAFTVKNIAGDTGTSLAAGKSLMLIAGSSTANTNIVIALD